LVRWQRERLQDQVDEIYSIGSGGGEDWRKLRELERDCMMKTGDEIGRVVDGLEAEMEVRILISNLISLNLKGERWLMLNFVLEQIGNGGDEIRLRYLIKSLENLPEGYKFFELYLSREWDDLEVLGERLRKVRA
jgi:hypothetical protein